MATNNQLLSVDQLQESDIPISVIPNRPGGGQRAQYAGQGNGDPISGAQATINQLLESVQGFRKQNPIKAPFAAGTKTLAAKQLDEGKRQYDTSLAEETRQYDTSLAEERRQYDNNMAYKAANANSRAGSRSGSGSASLSKNERVGYVLKGAVSEYNRLINSRGEAKDVTLNGITYPMSTNKYTPEKAAQEIIGQIYNNLGSADLSISDASNVVEAFTKAIGLQTGETQTPKQQLENFLSQKEMDYYKENPDDLKDRFGR